MIPYNYYQGYSVPQASQDERIWVNNEVAAEAYRVAPSGFVRLWDNSQNRFYEKRADASGRPLPMDVYQYEKVTVKSKSELEYEDIDNRLRRLEEMIQNATESHAIDTTVQSVQEPI